MLLCSHCLAYLGFCFRLGKVSVFFDGTILFVDILNILLTLTGWLDCRQYYTLLYYRDSFYSMSSFTSDEMLHRLGCKNWAYGNGHYSCIALQLSAMAGV